MATNVVRIRCSCERLVLTVADVCPEVANRVVCYCHGCQAFAQRMAPTMMAADGGTERFQVSPASVAISSGREHLACLQQTRNGALRWYASCCDTPIGLTLTSPNVPFVGIDAHGIDRDTLGAPLGETLGPIRARVNSPFRGGEAHRKKADGRSLLRMLWHLAPLTFRWWWRNDHKRSPFFDATTKLPSVEPQRLYATPLLGTAGCR